MNTPSRFFTLRALLVLGLVAACKDSSGPPDKVATTLAVHAGNNQGANAGTPLAQPLAVLVTDADNQPVPNVAVTFVVRSGGGSITGGAARSGDDGIATAGTWTLGTSLGTNTVEATAAGLPTVTFTATGRCGTSGTLALGATLSGILTVSDCKYSGGELTDRYTFTTSAQQAVRFYQSSQLIDTYLELYDAGNFLLSANDDSAGIAGHPTSTMKMLLAPGTYELSPSSYGAGETGGYSLSAVAVPESENTCELVFGMPGITVVGELATGDCATSTGFLYEPIAIVLRTGRTYTITLNSTAFDAYLELGVLGGSPVAVNDNANGTNARITFTPTSSNFFVIIASSAVTGTSGAFTLIIE